MLNLFVLSFFLPLLKLHLLVLDSFEIIEVTFVIYKLVVEEMNDLLSSDIQEISSVRYNNDSNIELSNVVFKPNQSIKIQVICGLIQ